MPNKVTEFCDAIRAVQKLAGEIFSGNPGISTTSFHRKIVVSDMRNLEQVPGDVEISVREYDKAGYPWKASKVFEGTEFMALLTAEQYEELQKAS